MGKVGRATRFFAARVLKTARQRKNAPHFAASYQQSSAGVAALENIAPAETLTRTIPPQHPNLGFGPPPPHGFYRPQRIVYPEDKLRRRFFRDHPWELARPRLIMELDGLDGRYRDWSKGLKQTGMKLSGESVVQRQLWLMENKGLSENVAYDLVRKEFYKLRHQEDVERRIAVEEARIVGGYFGKDDLRVGLEVEDQSYKWWKAWADRKLAEDEARAAGNVSSVVDEVPEEIEDIEETEEVEEVVI